MNDELRTSITAAFQYLDGRGIPIPPDILLTARRKGLAFKKGEGDLSAVNAKYHDVITKALTDYFEGGNINTARNAFRRAVTESFGSAFDLGWVDGGQELPFTGEALEWFNARVEQEFGYGSMLFQEAKEIRREKDFDYFSWVTFHADNYTRTLREIYNAARLRAMEDIYVTFAGDDGEESCATCQRLKGKRHKISWFVKRNYIPPFGTGLICHPGRNCQHGLMDDKGNWVTV